MQRNYKEIVISIPSSINSYINLKINSYINFISPPFHSIIHQEGP